jgi:hypothetical protein
MTRSLPLLVALLLGAAHPDARAVEAASEAPATAEADTLAAADADSTTEEFHKFRQVTLYLLGGQFATGGVGMGFELRSRSGRYAILAGMGQLYLKFDQFEEPLPMLSWGVGAKRYFDGGKHQFYAQTALGPYAARGTFRGTRDDPEFIPHTRYYANSLGLGYRYTSYRGFTFVGGYNLIWLHLNDRVYSEIDSQLGWSW